MIQIHTRKAGEVHILDLKGKFRANTEGDFWNAVQASVVEGGARKLVLNFKELEECDSYAITELLRVRKSILNMGGRLIIVHINALIERVFHITKVEELLDIRESEAEALTELGVPAV